MAVNRVENLANRNERCPTGKIVNEERCLNMEKTLFIIVLLNNNELIENNLMTFYEREN